VVVVLLGWWFLLGDLRGQLLDCETSHSLKVVATRERLDLLQQCLRIFPASLRNGSLGQLNHREWNNPDILLEVRLRS
jgi:hypothetical protein